MGWFILSLYNMKPMRNHSTEYKEDENSSNSINYTDYNYKVKLVSVPMYPDRLV